MAESLPDGQLLNDTTFEHDVEEEDDTSGGSASADTQEATLAGAEHAPARAPLNVSAPARALPPALSLRKTPCSSCRGTRYESFVNTSFAL